MKILIVGVTCTGKTTLADKYVNKGFIRLKEYTTRPMRNSNENQTYNFVDDDFFLEMINKNVMISYKKFYNYYYGISKEDWKKNNFVLVTNPHTVLKLYEEHLLNDVFLIKLIPDIKIIKERIKKRNQNNGIDNYDYNDRIKQNLIDMNMINHIKADLVLKEWLYE